MTAEEIGSPSALELRYDPMSRDELIAECERLRSICADGVAQLDSNVAEIGRLRAWRARMVAIPSPSAVCGLLGCQNLNFHVHDVEQGTRSPE